MTDQVNEALETLTQYSAEHGHPADFEAAISALSALAHPARGVVDDEDRFEQYVATLIAKNPDVRKLGERLADWLDEDRFNTINPILLGIAQRLAALSAVPSKHRFWGAGESECPADIKAPNGELHTLRCKVCGQDSPKGECQAALPAVPVGGHKGQPCITDEMVRDAFLALGGKVIDGRHPMHSDEAGLLRDAIAAAINAAPSNAQPAVPSVPEECQWSGDEMGLWESACGILYQFTTDGPVENKHNYCHSCGKPLVLAATPAHDQPEGEG